MLSVLYTHCQYNNLTGGIEMKTDANTTPVTGRRVKPRTPEPHSKRKTVTKNLRVESSVNALIEQAAASAGTTFTSFVLEAAALQAERHLLDKCFLTVDAKAFAEIETLLAQDHQPTERLRALFNKNKEAVRDAADNYAEVRLEA
jgi:uncharacterized protein (DUF1778 family)